MTHSRMQPGRRPTRFSQLLSEARLTQEQLARLAGTSKQQINRYATGERLPNVRMAKLISPHLGIDWQVLLEAETADERLADAKDGIAVRKPPPVLGEPLNDADELALIGLWRGLSILKKAALFANLGADEMPSLRKLA